MLVDQIDSRLHRWPRDAFTMTTKERGRTRPEKRHKTRFDIETLHNHPMLKYRAHLVSTGLFSPRNSTDFRHPAT